MIATKTELFITKAQQIHGYKYDYSKVNYINAKTNRVLPFDFVIEENKIIIELDGQHFKQVSNWKSPEIQLEKDIYKMKCANNNGFSVIRLLEEDVIKNKYNWLEEIKLNIKKIINEKVVQNIFICKNNEYYSFHLTKHFIQI